MLNRISSASRFDTSEVEQRFDLREPLSFIWRQWKFISANVAVVFLIGVVVLLRQAPLYTATALVMLDQQREKAPGAEAILFDASLEYEFVENQLAIIKSDVFLRRVVEKENLVSDPEFGTRAPQNASTSALSRVWFGSTETAESNAPAADEKSLESDIMLSTEALKGAVSVTRSGQALVLAISVTGTDPARAGRLANAVAGAYLVDKLDNRFEAAKRASAWLSDRLVELRNQLRESEEAVVQFRSQNGLFQSGTVTFNQQQLSELNAKLLDARAEAAQKMARADLIASIQAQGGSLQNVPDVSNAGALPSLREQAASLSQQEANLLARYSAAHPLVGNVRAQQRDVERAIIAETQRLVGGVKNEYQLSQARVASLERSLREATGQSGIDDAAGIRLRELERTAAVNKNLFEDFLQRAKITQQQSTFEARDARIITAARPGSQSYPRTNRHLMIYLLTGLALGVGGAVAREMLNFGFTAPKQIEEMLGLPVLASVSRMEARDLMVDGTPIPIWFYPTACPMSRYGEAMRALRVGIQMTDLDDPPKVIQLTSTAPGEGKSTIAMSFAASAGSSGLKVLLIDADLRHSSVSWALDLHKETGLVDLLLERVNAKDAIRFIETAGYWALAAGAKTQNPIDLLGSDRMKALVASFRQSFDLVVIDCPPQGPLIDPLVVSQLSDTIVLVVRWASTARERVKHCVEQFLGHRKIAGVVLNQVVERDARKYGRHAYSYYYGSREYKKYYGE
jgi:polysaccharide biosynthesis transport protein